MPVEKPITYGIGFEPFLQKASKIVTSFADPEFRVTISPSQRSNNLIRVSLTYKYESDRDFFWRMFGAVGGNDTQILNNMRQEIREKCADFWTKI